MNTWYICGTTGIVWALNNIKEVNKYDKEMIYGKRKTILWVGQSEQSQRTRTHSARSSHCWLLTDNIESQPKFRTSFLVCENARIISGIGVYGLRQNQSIFFRFDFDAGVRIFTYGFAIFEPFYRVAVSDGFVRQIALHVQSRFVLDHLVRVEVEITY